MTNEPQLFMRHPDLKTTDPVILPEGIRLITHTDKLEREWEILTEKAFGMHFSFEKTIKNAETSCGYSPKHTLYLTDGNKILATATATEKESFPGEGWFRMIAASPEESGKGYGRLICLAALNSLEARGYKSAVLSTDDYRIPAIRTYLSLGFRPIFTHESHSARWQNIYKSIENMKK